MGGQTGGVKANDLAIKALRPRDREYEVSVREHRGLVVRVHPTGTKSFIHRYRQDGILKRVALQSTKLADARREWETLKASVKEGNDPAEEAKAAKAVKQLKRMEERAASSIKELAEDFIDQYAKPNKRSWKGDEQMLQGVVIPEWGAVKVRDITRQDVRTLVQTVARRAPVRANRVLAVVRKMFAWAVEDGRIEESPCLGVKAPTRETARDRVLSEAEIRSFLSELDSAGLALDVQAALKIQLLTACRVGEIISAKWSDFDMKNKQWLIPGERSKNGRASLLPLSAAAFAIVDGIEKSGPWLFGRRGKKVPHLRIDVVTHELAQAQFSIDTRFTSHDLRRTAATNLAALGTSRVVLDAILNHKDRTVGAVYDRHDYFHEKRVALEAWATRLNEIVSGRQSQKVVPIRA